MSEQDLRAPLYSLVPLRALHSACPVLCWTGKSLKAGRERAVHSPQEGEPCQALAAVWGGVGSRDAVSLPVAGGKLAGAAGLAAVRADCRLLFWPHAGSCPWECWSRFRISVLLSTAQRFPSVVPYFCIRHLAGPSWPPSISFHTPRTEAHLFIFFLSNHNSRDLSVDWGLQSNLPSYKLLFSSVTSSIFSVSSNSSFF